MVINVILIAVLIYESICDIRDKHIRIIPLAIVGIMGLSWGLIYGDRSWQSWLMGLIPGGVLLFAGWAGRQTIGYGDGIVVLVIGMCLGGSIALVSLWLGLVLAGITGIILIFLKKGGRKMRLALCPYLLIGLIISLAVEVYG